MVTKRLVIMVLFCLILVLPLTAQAQAPTLRQKIHQSIMHNTRIPNSSPTMTSTWTVISLADADPADPSHVLTIYGNQSVPRMSAGNDIWDREHLWPQSFGTGDESDCGFPHNDVHHLFASEPDLNQSRSNHPFDDCADADCSEKKLRDETDRANWLKGGDLDRWEVWANIRSIATVFDKRRVLASGGRRGDVARALFYMDVRYEGGLNPATSCVEPDLVLTNDRSLIVSKPTTTTVGYMGMLATMCRWHREDPVDALELHRNNVIARFQGNRNPFIDRPDLASVICGSSVYMPYASRGATLMPPTATPIPSNTPLPSATPRRTNTPPPTATPQRIPPTARPTNTPVPPPPPTATPLGSADLAITALQCEGRDETIRILNRGGSAVSMSGWSILSVVGPQTFPFPSYTLNPGAAVTVHSGPDAPASGGDNLRWTTGYIWNNDGDEAQLKNPQGGVVDIDDC